jgi:hypothetical protein
MIATSASAQEKDPFNTIKNPRTVKIYGVPLKGGGCAYSGTLAIPPDGAPIRQEIIYQEPTSCTMVAVQGEPVTPKPVQRPDGSSKADAKTASAARAGSGESVTVNSAYNSVAYLHTWLEDPVNWDVNSVTSYINWWWNGYYVIGTFRCSNYRWWQPWWHEQDSNLWCYQDSSGKAVSSTYSRFYATGWRTTAIYNRNNARGAGNGWLYWDYYMQWWGGCCWSWLHASHEAGFL